MMEKDRLIEIMTSALDNGLCGGCKPSVSPYAYENGGSCDKCRHIAAIEIASIIRSDAPTVDAVPVRHGRWIHHKWGYSDHYECTACGKPIVLTAKWDFCPNCGAQMDGKDGEGRE